jgi:6,7-dimethyl-8-ribityllumazine synthase
MTQSVRGLKLEEHYLDSNHLRVGIIKTRWNVVVVDALVQACTQTLIDAGVREIAVEEVGGAFELPLVASMMAKSGQFDVIIPIGCLIKGETMHFEYISGAAVEGLMQVGLDTGIPVINGILNVLNEPQALARAGLEGTHGNEGIGWAKTAIQQVRLVSKYRRV